MALPEHLLEQSEALLQTPLTPDAGSKFRSTKVARRALAVKLGVLLVLLLAALCTFLALGPKATLHKLLQWTEENPGIGLFVFSLFYIVATVAILPTAILAVASGAIWGWAAIPVVWVSAIIGETAAFVLGRFALRSYVLELASSWHIWQALELALQDDGWKLVALLRLSPAVPFSLLNYALGTSSLSLQQFFWPSLFGIVPGIVVSVWLGTMARDISEVMSGAHKMSAQHKRAEIAILVVGLVSGVVVLVAGAIYTKRAVERRLALRHIQHSSDHDDPAAVQALLESGLGANGHAHQVLNVSPAGPDGPGGRALAARLPDVLSSGSGVLQRPSSQTRLQQHI